MQQEKEFAGWRKQGARTHSMAGMQLSTIQPHDEFLHPPAASGHYTSTETSYFGFSIPEHLLNGEIYIWFHPVLQVMSASVYIWKGLKGSTLAGDYVNHFHFLPFPANDIADYCIEALNLRIKVLEPLRRIQLDFSDPDRDVAFCLLQEAIMPPAGRPDGFHFTQAMKVTGELTLLGEHYSVDGFFTRDRSWSQERRETAQTMPPLSWMVGVFDADFAFHVMAFDDPACKPEWTRAFPAVMPGENLFWGYVYRDGQVVPVRAAAKLTRREQDGLAPRCVEMAVEDANGRHFAIRGDVQARMPWQTWQAMNVFFCQTRWHCDGHIGYGDLQDVQFNAFSHAFGR